MLNDTGFRMLEIPLAMSARIGIQEDRDIVNDAKIERTWNGDPIVMKSPFPKKAKVSLSASSKAIRAEACFDGVEVGDQVTIHSMKSSVGFVAPGATTVDLHWPVVPGAAPQAFTVSDGKRVACTVADVVEGGVTKHRVTLTAGASTDVVAIRYRPVIVCLITKWSGTAATTEGTETWRAELEEV